MALGSLVHAVFTQAALVGVTATTLTWARAVSAQPSDSERETARSLMDEGDRLMAGGDLEGALKRYQAAHQIMDVPTTGIEVARTQAKLGRLVEARAVAIEVANSAAAQREPAVFGEARTEASKLADQLEARIPSIIVTVGPEGVTTASARVESTRLPQAAFGLPFKVNPGEHKLEVSALGYLTEVIDFTVVEGEQRKLAVTLTQAPASTPSPAVVTTVAAPPPPPPTEPEGGSRTLTYVAFGVAGAAALVGGGAGVYSLMKTGEAKDNYCQGNVCEEAARPLLDDASTYAWVANIGLGVAFLAAGFGAYTLLFGEDSESNRTGSLRTLPINIAVSPRVDSASLIYTGAF